MANERIKEKLKQCQQVQGILQKIVDQTSWASDMGDFRDISERLDDVCEAAENALEDIDEMVSYYEDKLEEFEDRLNEFVNENEVEE